MGRRPKAQIAHLQGLASDARPLSDDEWGSERQVEAQNRFHLACEAVDPVTFAEGGDYYHWCLKATSEEMIDEALRLLGATPKV